jgi:tRNA G10  N-methylase Trm11
MSEYRSICVLGRQPAIGRAELESLFGADSIAKFGEHALTTLPAEEIPFKRLGGTLKIARILAELSSLKWNNIEKYLILNIPKYVQQLPDGKFTFGLSVYGLAIDVNQINKTGLKLKKLIKSKGKIVRVVPNKEQSLNTAQVLHNKLTYRGGWELIIISDGTTIYLAQTIFVQDITAYAERDQARPKRDNVVGMLPPKLAQIIINLAVGNPKHFYNKSGGHPPVVLDPFCGTGVILQEALLIGYDVVGSDIEPRMVEYTQENIEWLKKLYPKLNDQMVELEVIDATKSYSTKFYNTIASEVYLGPVLKGRINQQAIEESSNLTNSLLIKFLQNLKIKPGVRFCMAIPAWRISDEFIHLPLLDQLADLGYNRVSFVHAGAEELIYHRPGQVVARELVVLKKIKE